MSRLRNTLACLAVCGFTLLGCGAPHIPEPAYGDQKLPDNGYTEVDKPPPAVQPSEITRPPSGAHVWVDGQWNYQRGSSKWTWEEGSWCVPPRGAVYYAKPALRRVRKPLGRVTRWDDFTKRFEEVDSGEDVWLWARGRWYVKTQNGGTVPSTDNGTCVVTAT